MARKQAVEATDEKDAPVGEETIGLDTIEFPAISGPESEPEPEPEETFETVTMACNPRLGSHDCKGPVTGNSYHISSTGTPGIDIRDAEVIKSTPISIRCMRTGKWIQIIPAGITR